jgi:hypothetical protein
MIEAIPGTKLVEIRMSAFTRVELTELMRVPSDITEDELHMVTSRRYEEVDAGEFTQDPEYFERGSNYAEPSSGEGFAAVGLIASRDENGQIDYKEAADGDSTGEPDGRKVYVSAHGEGDYFDHPPEFAWFIATQSLVRRLEALRSLCEFNNLNEVAVAGAPAYWGPQGTEEYLQLRVPQMYVNEESFWFSDYPKHASAPILTARIDFKDLLPAIAAEGDGPVFIDFEPDVVAENAFNDKQFENLSEAQLATIQALIDEGNS